jgi:predicted DNA-binding transcriptional regulator AlpA
MAKAELNTAADLLVKREVAALLRCSERQVELLTRDRRIPAPRYLGKQSPRWVRAELLAALGLESAGAGG